MNPLDPIAPGSPAASGELPDIARCMLSVFPTPVVNYRWPDAAGLNTGLEAVIASASERRPSLVKSNVGGWHSGLDFLNWDTAPTRELRTRLQRFVVQLTRLVLKPEVKDRKAHFQLNGWANRMQRGDYHAPHSHPGSFWSGVYYVTGTEEVEGHPMSGKLELMDPRAAAGTVDAQETNLCGRYLFSPVAGQMIVCPSWLLHWVHPHFGDKPRVSVAFNVGFELQSA